MTAATRFGAQVLESGLTRFALWAPAQREVALEIEGRPAARLQHAPGGWFVAETDAPAGTRYRFRVDNGGSALSIPDPASRAQADDVHGASVVVDPKAFRWQHRGWRGRPWEEAVIYELHPGLMGGFTGIEAMLPRLAELGITAVELMPVADFPGPRNWGYDGVLPYAPDPAYGTPDELRHLVDTAHGLGLMVFLDVVYNHFGPDGNYLGLTAPQFFRDDIQTPWGAAIDFRRPEVRAFFTGNAIHWIDEYRFDGLRFDAVHAISESDWLDEMALAVREAAGPDRHVHLVLENDDNIASHLEPTPRRFDAQWNDDAHHVLHVLLTGEKEGYYGDYDGGAEDEGAPSGAAPGASRRLARVLAEGFAYQGEPSRHRKGEPRGTPSAHLPPTAFVDCLQNHDQIGNRAFGERLTTMADTQALQAAVALLLLSPHVPLIFMGEEVGSRTPFLYFTSHGDELAALVREGRRNEFAGFAAFADERQRERIPDPNAIGTFESSRPEDGAEPEQWLALYRRLLALRRTHVVPGLAGARSAGASAIGDSAAQARWTLGNGSTLLIATNLGSAPVPWRDAPDEGSRIYAGPAQGLADGELPGRCTVAFIVAASGRGAP